MNPALSIVVPVFNSAHRGLGACLKAILEQDFKEFELIIINDGSTDCSLDVCREFQQDDCRVVIIDKENGGVSAAVEVSPSYIQLL